MVSRTWATTNVVSALQHLQWRYSLEESSKLFPNAEVVVPCENQHDFQIRIWQLSVPHPATRPYLLLILPMDNENTNTGKNQAHRLWMQAENWNSGGSFLDFSHLWVPLGWGLAFPLHLRSCLQLCQEQHFMDTLSFTHATWGLGPLPILSTSWTFLDFFWTFYPYFGFDSCYILP